MASNYSKGNNEQLITPSPRRNFLKVALAAVAQGVDLVTVVGTMPNTGDVESVKLVPSADIAGAANDKRAFDLLVINETTGATISTTPLRLGAVGEGTLTALKVNNTADLSAVAALKGIAAGRVLAIKSKHVGAGLADPGGYAEVAVTNGVKVAIATN